MSLALISFYSITALFISHWIAIQFYARYCAPPGLYGFIDAMLKSPSPICIGTNYIQFYSIKYYYAFWISMILSFCKLLQEKITKLQGRLINENSGGNDKSGKK